MCNAFERKRIISGRYLVTGRAIVILSGNPVRKLHYNTLKWPTHAATKADWANDGNVQPFDVNCYLR